MMTTAKARINYRIPVRFSCLDKEIDTWARPYYPYNDHVVHAGQFATALRPPLGPQFLLQQLWQENPIGYFSTVESQERGSRPIQVLTRSGAVRAADLAGNPEMGDELVTEFSGLDLPHPDPVKDCGKQAEYFHPVEPEPSTQPSPQPPTNLPALVVCDVGVRQDGYGRYCLNDLHRAAVQSGENARTKETQKFLSRQETLELIQEIQNTQNLGVLPVDSVRGRNGGTFVVEDLVYAYAMWISPAFHLKVIHAYKALVTGKLQPQLDPQAHLNDPAWLRQTLIGYTEQVEKLTNEVKGQQQKLEAAKVVIDSSRTEIKETRKELGARERELKKTAAVLRVKEVEVDELTSIIRQLIESEGSITLDEAAKCFGWGPRKFDALLREKGWLCKTTTPRIGKEPHVQNKDLVHKVTTYTNSLGATHVATQVRVTGQGLEKLARLIKKWEK